MFLVGTYLCINGKAIKSVHNVCTKTFDFIDNFFHHGENQTNQEVGGG